MNRRTFLANSAGLALAAAAPRAFGADSTAAPHNKIRVGVIGVGARGTEHVRMLSKMPDVEIAYLCDVDRGAFTRATAILQDERGAVPKRVPDMREIFADKSVDAVFIATGHNWHALATIWACQAGKDVYVEKPMALTLREGRLMVQAARKYGRVVQVGSQTESAPFFRQALDYARSGKLGAIRLARTQIMENARYPKVYPKPGESAPVPAGLDWDMFCGPAPLAPYFPGRWWGDLWDYTLGGLVDHSAHQLSMIRQLLDLPAPKSVCTFGSILQTPGEDRVWESDFGAGPMHMPGRPLQAGELDARRQIFDTCYATFAWDRRNVIFEGCHWAPYMRTPYHEFGRKDGTPAWFRANRVEVLGTDAFLLTARHAGGWQVFDKGDNPVAGGMGRKDDTHHIRNFLECLRSRARPNSDVEIAHTAMTMNHLMIASHRAGNVKLLFDAATETVTNVPEANRFLTRPGRGEFKIPDTV